MKVGDFWECPHCGKSSFLKKESVMDGWKKTGEVLKCAACSALVEEIHENTDEQQSKSAETQKKSALMALLGEDAKPEVHSIEKEETRFCRDCKFRVMTAFQIFCTKWDKEVGPMDDCNEYQKREE